MSIISKRLAQALGQASGGSLLDYRDNVVHRVTVSVRDSNPDGMFQHLLLPFCFEIVANLRSLNENSIIYQCIWDLTTNEHYDNSLTPEFEEMVADLWRICLVRYVSLVADGVNDNEAINAFTMYVQQRVMDGVSNLFMSRSEDYPIAKLLQDENDQYYNPKKEYMAASSSFSELSLVSMTAVTSWKHFPNLDALVASEAEKIKLAKEERGKAVDKKRTAVFSLDTVSEDDFKDAGVHIEAYEANVAKELEEEDKMFAHIDDAAYRRLEPEERKVIDDHERSIRLEAEAEARIKTRMDNHVDEIQKAFPGKHIEDNQVRPHGIIAEDEDIGEDAFIGNEDAVDINYAVKGVADDKSFDDQEVLNELSVIRAREALEAGESDFAKANHITESDLVQVRMQYDDAEVGEDGELFYREDDDDFEDDENVVWDNMSMLDEDPTEPASLDVAAEHVFSNTSHPYNNASSAKYFFGDDTAPEEFTKPLPDKPVNNDRLSTLSRNFLENGHTGNEHHDVEQTRRKVTSLSSNSRIRVTRDSNPTIDTNNAPLNNSAALSTNTFIYNEEETMRDLRSEAMNNSQSQGSRQFNNQRQQPQRPQYAVNNGNQSRPAPTKEYRSRFYNKSPMMALGLFDEQGNWIFNGPDWYGFSSVPLRDMYGNQIFDMNGYPLSIPEPLIPQVPIYHEVDQQNYPVYSASGLPRLMWLDTYSNPHQYNWRDHFADVCNEVAASVEEADIRRFDEQLKRSEYYSNNAPAQPESGYVSRAPESGQPATDDSWLGEVADEYANMLDESQQARRLELRNPVAPKVQERPVSRDTGTVEHTNEAVSVNTTAPITKITETVKEIISDSDPVGYIQYKNGSIAAVWNPVDCKVIPENKYRFSTSGRTGLLGDNEIFYALFPTGMYSEVSLTKETVMELSEHLPRTMNKDDLLVIDVNVSSGKDIKNIVETSAKGETIAIGLESSMDTEVIVGIELERVGNLIDTELLYDSGVSAVRVDVELTNITRTVNKTVVEAAEAYVNTKGGINSLKALHKLLEVIKGSDELPMFHKLEELLTNYLNQMLVSRITYGAARGIDSFYSDIIELLAFGLEHCPDAVKSLDYVLDAELKSFISFEREDAEEVLLTETDTERFALTAYIRGIAVKLTNGGLKFHRGPISSTKSLEIYSELSAAYNAVKAAGKTERVMLVTNMYGQIAIICSTELGNGNILPTIVDVI